jgi:hypothetical protein
MNLQAKNIVNYLRIIHRILAVGGVWINLGPLLWHWENNTSGDMSIELDLEEVKELARTIGFDISVRTHSFPLTLILWPDTCVCFSFYVVRSFCRTSER